MISKLLDRMSVDQLQAVLRRMESDADAQGDDDVTGVQILQFTKGRDSTREGNWVFYGPQDLVIDSSNQIQVRPINGPDEKSKEGSVWEIVKNGNMLISYATLLTQTADQDVAVFRNDPKGVTKEGTQPGFLPQGRQAFLRSLPWEKAKPGLKSFIGLAQNGLHFFEENGKITAVFIESGASISTDGPGGSKAVDPDWLPGTALEVSPNVGCDSRKFFGVVIPPWIRDRFGVRMGDFAIVINKDKSVPCQVYDIGPAEKIGEVSVALAWELGIPPKPGDQLTKAGAQELGIAFAPGNTLQQQQAEHLAATRGNDVKDLVTLIFPGSGSRNVRSQGEIEAETGKFLAAFAGRGSSAAALGELAGDPPATVDPIGPGGVLGSAQQRYNSRSEAIIAALQPDFADRVLRWLQACRQKGLNPYIYSGSRSPALQQKLRDDFLAHQGHKAVDPRLSYHCYGRAFDWVNIGDANAGAKGLEWNNDGAYRRGTAVAEGDPDLRIRGIGEEDNDHLQDASFPSFQTLRNADFGHFPNPPPVV